MNDRIKLAEAMGWGIGCDTCDGQEIGVPPGDTRPYGQGNLTVMPDPFTDANDCHALIKHLNGLGYYINIDFNHDGTVDMIIGKGDRYRDYELVAIEDYMQGVCELALKVLRDD